MRKQTGEKKEMKKKMDMANIAQQSRADRASRHFVSTAFLFSLHVDAHLFTILLPPLPLLTVPQQGRRRRCGAIAITLPLLLFIIYYTATTRIIIIHNKYDY